MVMHLSSGNSQKHSPVPNPLLPPPPLRFPLAAGYSPSHMRSLLPAPESIPTAITSTCRPCTNPLHSTPLKSLSRCFELTSLDTEDDWRLIRVSSFVDVEAVSRFRSIRDVVHSGATLHVRHRWREHVRLAVQARRPDQVTQDSLTFARVLQSQNPEFD